MRCQETPFDIPLHRRNRTNGDNTMPTKHGQKAKANYVSGAAISHARRCEIIYDRGAAAQCMR